MLIFKCKMCGGNVAPEQGSNSTGVCASCGTRQTVAVADDEKKINLFNRANRLRMAGEFDEAAAMYNSIVSEFPEEAEGYWGLCLCTYGIVYDNTTAAEQKPKCCRASYKSILEDENFKLVLELSDIYAKAIYRKEAREIAQIQKAMLATSESAEPFDIFICCKSTDDLTKQQTEDLVFAQDIYKALTAKGFKVFLDRITLADKPDTQHEPYIFAALNSAKVMLALGTRYEYYNAAYVKNVWIRFIGLTHEDKSKTLIPCFKDIDAYDMPEEFKTFRAVDMGKADYIEEIINGLSELLPDIIPQQTAQKAPETPKNAPAPLMKRAFMYLECGDFEKADKFCDTALADDPENAEAYLGKLMAELKCHTVDDLKNCEEPFDNSINYKKAVEFGDYELASVIEYALECVQERKKNLRFADIYSDASEQMATATSENEYMAAAYRFKSISGFNDADEKAEECFKKAADEKNAAVYARANAEQKKGTVKALTKAIELYVSISGWQDADEMADRCKNQIKIINANRENNRLIGTHRPKEPETVEEKSAFDEREQFVAETPEVKTNTPLSTDEKHIKKIAVAILAGVLCVTLLVILTEYAVRANKMPEIGSALYFGSYEQDDNTSNGQEDIEWIVLDKEDDKMLLISKYALDCRQYNSENTDVTWETCDLRKWLNEEFLDTAFSATEQERIITSNVPAVKHPWYDTDPGNATSDKIFLLSYPEVEKYFVDNETRKAAPTKYAAKQGCFVNDNFNTISGEGTCWWWLRSPGSNTNNASYVNFGGNIYYNPHVTHTGGGVRPALWLNLET